ncbi:MAG: hypothetical protein ACK6AD_04935 [Cyanobacteriota bacterium]
MRQPVADVDETGAPTGNTDGGNPKGKCGWLWVLVTPPLTVFLQGLSRLDQAASSAHPKPSHSGRNRRQAQP